MFDIDYDIDCKFKSTRFFSMEHTSLETEITRRILVSLEKGDDHNLPITSKVGWFPPGVSNFFVKVLFFQCALFGRLSLYLALLVCPMCSLIMQIFAI